ncbi:hypothetical protein [Lacinutrix jangbogonensis]|uniref:hypothetical protein n=1 Tax=Lacinutrix jangbogonensis TaxID=1469557 RepID=UPI00053E8027|nr:hypothetical protein [Lacinutrix jangbogonensis]
MLFETTLDEKEHEVQKITYNYDKCKSAYITDLLDDSNSQNPNKIFSCKTKTTVKKISNFTFSTVYINKIGVGEVKKIDLKQHKDKPILRYYTFSYKEDENSIQTNLHKKDKIKVY